MTKGKPGRPPSRLPRRYKKHGKHVGSFYFRADDGADINLRTTDAELANARAKLVKKGQRDFKADSGAPAAEAVVNALAGTEGATTPPVVEPPAPPAPNLPPPAASTVPVGFPSGHSAPAALPPIPSSSSAPEPAKPDTYYPPPAGWADAVRGAAADAQGAAERASSAEDAEEEGGTFSPDMLDDMLEQAAEGLVRFQIWLQAFALKKGWVGAKIKAAPVPDDAKAYEIGKRLWKRVGKRLASRYMPGLEIPDWIATPLLVGSYTVMVQLGEGATIIKDEAKQETAAAPAEGQTAAAA